jgi:aminopeptidase N
MLDPRPRRRGPVTLDQTSSPPPSVPKPAERLEQIADQVADAMVFYRHKLGEPPTTHLEVSPIPGRFGQGFGGIIYLPTVNYIQSDTTPQGREAAFFRDLLVAHEVAHQWWGNIVTTATYHSEWLMEALANYCAIMYLEKRLGPRATETALDVYRRNLFLKGEDGESAENEGPLVQGRRLESSGNPVAFTAVIYGKGSWVIHMLRRRMGDERFLSMLAELRRRYEYKTIDTEQFRRLCAEFLPRGSADPQLEGFFDQWVYGTGVPSLKLTYSVKGKPGAYRLIGTIAQSDVDEDFSVAVPVEIQTGRAKAVVQQVRTASEPVQFSVPVASPSARAVLDPGWSVLRR